MSLLQEEGVEVVHHYTPLHYLPFIARERALLCKPSLRARGYSEAHMRSKSRHHDEARGFGSYAFLTLFDSPRILMAKLRGGFPHVDIVVPPMALQQVEYDLCRYNVAMTRYLRRDQSPGFPEGPSNGRYYDDYQIPVARTDADKRAMLQAHLNKTMIEVLVDGDLPLPDDTIVQTYSAADRDVAEHVLSALEIPWHVELRDPASPYNRREDYGQQVDEFIEKALADPSWLGSGLEFDKL